MEIKTDSESLKYMKCYKIPEETYGSLRVTNYEYNHQNWIVLWNRFTIIVKDCQNLAETQVVHYPDILIKSIYFIRNIFLCLDCDNVLNFTILRQSESDTTLMQNLKFKSILKSVYDITHTDNEIFVFVKKETDCFVYIYNIIGSSKMKVSNKIKVTLNISDNPIKINVKSLRYFSIDYIENVLAIDTIKQSLENYVCFYAMKDSLYWMVMKNDENINLLYSFPVEIKSVDFSKELCSKIFVTLVTGSVMILFYNINEKCIDVETVHLNCSIERTIFVEDSFLYTDGVQTWYSTVEMISDETITKHKLLKLTNSYDFVINETDGKVFCTTLHKTLYHFLIDSDECFKTKVTKTSDDFSFVPKSFKNTQMILNEIWKETEKNAQISNMILEENAMITALALNRKPGMVKDHIIFSVKIYDNFNAIPYIKDTVFTNTLQDYFAKNVHIFVIDCELSKEFVDKFRELNRIKDKIWHVNVKLSSESTNRTIQFSIGLKNSDKIRCVIPIQFSLLVHPVKLALNFVALIPGTFKKDHFWCVLPSNLMSVDATYFLNIPRDNPLKRFHSNLEEYDIEKKIYNSAMKNCGLICNIVKIDRIKNAQNFTYYVRLPDDFSSYSSQFFDAFITNVNIDTRKKIIKITGGNLNDYNKCLTLNVYKEPIEISLDQTDSKILRLKIKSCDNDACCSIFTFVLGILRSLKYEKVISKTIPHFDFMILQNLRENLNSVNSSEHTDAEALYNISEDFYRDIVGILPVR